MDISYLREMVDELIQLNFENMVAAIFKSINFKLPNNM